MHLPSNKNIDYFSTYTYGTLGELKSVRLPDTTTIEYLHNANNQRVAKKVNGIITEKYLWADLTTLLAVYDGNGNLVQRFKYADGRMPISMMQNNQKYYLHYDQVGTLKAVSQEDGTIVKQVEYDTFGNVLSDSNETFKVPFGFAGGLYDQETKLTRFGYRDYDAETGKWTAKDPIGFDGGDTNLYGYVLGDPVNFVDPKGLEVRVGVDLPEAPTWVLNRERYEDFRESINYTLPHTFPFTQGYDAQCSPSITFDQYGNPIIGITITIPLDSIGD